MSREATCHSVFCLNVLSSSYSPLLISFVFQILSLSWGSLPGSQSWLSVLHYILYWTGFLFFAALLPCEWGSFVFCLIFSQWPPPKYKLHGGKSILLTTVATVPIMDHTHSVQICWEWMNRELVIPHLLLFGSFCREADLHRFQTWRWLASESEQRAVPADQREREERHQAASWLRSWP